MYGGAQAVDRVVVRAERRSTRVYSCKLCAIGLQAGKEGAVTDERRARCNELTRFLLTPLWVNDAIGAFGTIDTYINAQVETKIARAGDDTWSQDDR
jgi:hypothetical protein